MKKSFICRLLFALFLLGYHFSVLSQYKVSGLGALRASDLTFVSLSPEAEISILVMSPSQEAAFTLYGHAGLRVRDPERNTDLVFNYGTFPPIKEDYIYRFVQGTVDYMVDYEPSDLCFARYSDRDINELKLRLSKASVDWIWSYLLWNGQEENRLYKYNFFRDNCATRLLDIIEWSLIQDSPDQRLSYDESKVEQSLGKRTWREVINELEAPDPWLVLGTDLALGARTDEICNLRDRAFIPRDLAILLRHASYTVSNESGGSQTIPLVASEERFAQSVQTPPMADLPWWKRPLAVIALLLLPLWIVSIRKFIVGEAHFLWLDVIYLSVIGLLGLILVYISYFTEHPYVDQNLNLWVLSPLHLLVGLPLLGFGMGSVWAYRYHFINFVVQIAFLLSSYFLPQSFNPTIYLLSVSLGLLSLSRIWDGRFSLVRHTL